MRLGLVCHYPSRSVKGVLAPAIPTVSHPAFLVSPHTQDQLWDTCDLALLHHFTTCCCIVVPGEHRRQLWKKEVVSLAFAHTYVLSQILAVSALHLYREDPSSTHLIAKAVEHRGQALARIHRTLAGMNAEVCIPVFAFAGLSMVFAFADVAIQLDADGANYDPVGHIAECLQQNFGINTVLQSYKEDIQASWASELINLDSKEDFDRLATSGLVFAHEKMLHELIDAHEYRKEWQDACHGALTLLLQTAQILMWRPQDHFTYHLINAWPTKLAPQFWQLLATKSPVALLVLAYFAAVASLRPNLWWLHRWPQLLVRDITARLGKAWEEALAWPIQIVNDHPQHMQ